MKYSSDWLEDHRVTCKEISQATGDSNNVDFSYFNKWVDIQKKFSSRYDHHCMTDKEKRKLLNIAKLLKQTFDVENQHLSVEKIATSTYSWTIKHSAHRQNGKPIIIWAYDLWEIIMTNRIPSGTNVPANC